MLFLTILISSLTWEVIQACESLQVFGAISQKGVEGEYAIKSTCTDIGNSVLYIQTEPAAGWGSVFYLYYYDTPEEWKGWMFSLYPCSDIPFVRNENNAQSPILIDEPWEEFMMDTFLQNPDLKVECKGSFSVHMAVAFFVTGLLLLLTGVIILPLAIQVFKNRKNTDANTHSTNTSATQTGADIFNPHLPSYSEIENHNTNQMNQTPSITPPAYSDIHFESSSNSQQHQIPYYWVSSCDNNNNCYTDTSNLDTCLPPSYEEVVTSNNRANNYTTEV